MGIVRTTITFSLRAKKMPLIDLFLRLQCDALCKRVVGRDGSCRTMADRVIGFWQDKPAQNEAAFAQNKAKKKIPTWQNKAMERKRNDLSAA